MIKEELKNVKVLYYTLKILLKIKRTITKATRVILLKPFSKKEKIRVGFIIQLPSIWEKQKDIYNEMVERKNIEVFLFAVPQFNWSKGNTIGEEVDEFFTKNYPELIEICNCKDAKSKILEYNLDYLFYPRPYDQCLPKELRSTSLYRYIKCCYIPYGMSGAEVFDGGNIYNPFFDNISAMYMDSLSQYQLMRKQYILSSNLGKRRIKYLGYPALYKYLFFDNNIENGCITWTPRWSTDSIIGGSSFVEFADYFLDLAKNSRYRLIFRPHPLMFDELVSKGIITEGYKENYIKELDNYNVEFDISTPIDEIFKKTSILITDFSSIIPQFFLTGRPIIYCEKGIKLNQIYKEMIDLNYIACSWFDVINELNDLTNNIDCMKNKRLEYIDKNYRSMGNPSIKIVDDLINGGKK